MQVWTRPCTIIYRVIASAVFAQTTTTIGSTEPLPDHGSLDFILFGLLVLGVIGLVGLLVYGEEILAIVAKRLDRSTPSSRGGALEFVEAHPALVTLGTEDALLVARVLRDELDRRGRTDKRFQILLAILSLGAGVILGKLMGV